MARRIALLIGNDDYVDDDLKRLSAPWEDVTGFKDVLEEFGEFEAMSPLYNASLTQAQTAITQLFKRAGPDDTVLLYYTGHGVRDDENDLYFALPQTNVDLLPANALPAEFIRDAMRRSQASAQVIIIDCCHSGAFRMEGGKSQATAESVLKGDFIDTNAGDVAAEGKYILTASQPNQSAYELGGKSVFTRLLVDGLANGTASPNKTHVTIQDLYAHVYRMVKQEGAPQQPRLLSAASAPELVIARNPNPRVPIKPELLDNFWGIEPYSVLGAAHELMRIAAGTDKRLAADARAELVQRLEKPETPILVADPIRAWLNSKSRGDSGASDVALKAVQAEAEAAHQQFGREVQNHADTRSELEAQLSEAQATLSERSEPGDVAAKGPYLRGRNRGRLQASIVGFLLVSAVGILAYDQYQQRVPNALNR